MSENRIRALLEERRGYVLRDLPDRVAAVDAELTRLGYQPAREAAATGPAETATAPRARKR